jgi:UDP:flavonoid glycosyltransferase YjiC (YdhE family)
MAALCEGLPQLVVPQGSDHFVNGQLLCQTGVGISSELSLITADALTTFLSDTRLRDAARAVSRDIAAMPPPASVVPLLAAVRP